MRNRRGFHFLPLVFLLLITQYSYGTQIISLGGLWHETTTWEGGIIPGPTDSVLINGNVVTVLDQNITVARVHIINFNTYTGFGSIGKLQLLGSTSMVCEGELYIQGEGKEADLGLYMEGFASLKVNGHLNIQRQSSNDDESLVKLYLRDGANITAYNGFTFDYHSSSDTESSQEIQLEDSSRIDVYGLTDFSNQNGNNFLVTTTGNSEINLYNNLTTTLNNGQKMQFLLSERSDIIVHGNSAFTNNGGGIIEFALYDSADVAFKGDLTLESGQIDKKVLLEAHHDLTNFYVGNNLKMITHNPGTVEIKLNAKSDLYLGGNLERPYGFGCMTMSNDAIFYLDGTTPQTLPSTNAFGQDSLLISNLEIKNTSGLILDGPFKVKQNLELISGTIQTTNTNILIVEDQVNIIGGGPDAYIDGPIQKIGRNNGNPFTFPLGKDGVYSPLTISSVVNADSKYTAQYFRGTPPNTDSLALGLNNVSTIEYWEFDIDPGTGFTGPELVNVTMGWTDADNSGINDLGDLVVARYNDATSQWMNTGNGGTTGSASSGQAGTLTHDNSCPPPCCHSILTYGSVIGSNPLPVELVYFNTTKSGQQVIIDWMTAAEVDLQEFEVEKSYDGFNFQAMQKIKATSATNLNQYQTIDKAPQTGDNYYRIKMVDADGGVRYSPIAIVSFDQLNPVAVHPNPIQDNFQLTGKELTGISQIEVYNQVGKRVHVGNYDLENNGTFHANDFNIRRPGLYFLYITNNGKISVSTIIKEND